MKSILYISILIAAAAAVTAGCNTTGCTDNQNSVPLAGFYSMTTGESVYLDSLAIGGDGAPNDTLLLGPGESASQVYLPLRSGHNSTTFVIKYMQSHLAALGIEDRITFYYDSTPFFASEECGALYYYRITRVSHTYQILDSIGISDSLITNVERQTIDLFFRTSQTEEPDDSTGDDGTDEDDPSTDDDTGDGSSDGGSDTDEPDDGSSQQNNPAQEVAQHG